MRRIALTLLALVAGIPGLIVASDQDVNTGGAAEAIKTLLEEIDSGAISEKDLTALLLAEAAAKLAKPESPNLSEAAKIQEDSRVDAAEERRFQPAAPIAADGAIMVNGVPVATLASPLVIPAAAFSSDGNDPDSSLFVFAGGYMEGSPPTPSDPPGGCVKAPVFLPADVTVTRLFASVWDNDPSRGVTVTLRRVQNFGSGAVDEMAAASTTAAFATAGIRPISDDTVVEPVVLYPDYSYYLTTCLGSENIRLYSVRLYFSL